MASTAKASGNVVDLFSREVYRGGNGIDNLESKLGQIGMADIEKLRADCYNVSNGMYFLIFGTMAMLTVVSGAQSVIIGYMMGGAGGILSAVEAMRMGLFQLTLLACGIVIGCWIGETSNKSLLAVVTLVLGALLLIVTITTGLAWLYYVQDIAHRQSNAVPLNHFFSAVAANSDQFENARDVQKTFNMFCVIVFELAVISTPILFKVINAPAREAWETRKRVKAFLATERSKQWFVDSIAETESSRLKADARIYRHKRLAEMETRAQVMTDMLAYEKRMARLWSDRKGLASSLLYRIFGIHDTDEDFIRYVTNADHGAGDATAKKR